MSHWNTWQGTLFRTDEEYPYWINADVFDINWTSDSGICPYCGNVMDNGVCPGCQNKATGTISGIAEVTFHGCLPNAARDIFNLYPGQTFEIVYFCEGIREIYDRPGWIGRIKLTVIRMKNRSMPRLVAFEPDDIMRIDLYTVAECNVEIILPEDDE